MHPETTNPITLRRSPATLDDPLYYLHNFGWVLDWVTERYSDLLSCDERQFVVDFGALPRSSQGLFVRMVMRKGTIFRADKLCYAELGATESALLPLVEKSWIDPLPVIDLQALFRLFTWGELRHMLTRQLAQAGFTGSGLKTARKADALIALTDLALEPMALAEWTDSDTPLPSVFELKLMPLCDRFRLTFFGNAHQDWSEFVLAELGTFQYEPVEFSDQSRPFHSRSEVDAYMQLQECRERFYNAQPLDTMTLAEITEQLPALPTDNPWLVRGRDRLVFNIAREWERAGELARAQALYQQCVHPEARSRHLRVLELQEQYQLALTLAQQAQSAPESEAERQQLQRLLPRLERKLGLPRSARKPAPPQAQLLELTLPRAPSVEQAVQEHLQTPDAPVYYVENTLLTGLLGLLCWDAIFAPLPGAFFHPFQRGPADLHWPDFYRRRAQIFNECLQSLEEGSHHTRILDCFMVKNGRQSPFIYWDALSQPLIEQALECIPAAHLKLCFERILLDIQANRAGLPDLIQLWPQQRQYRMIEVKGPGDRLQDNQHRWLNFFAAHNMPAAVCHVRWLDAGAEDV